MCMTLWHLPGQFLISIFYFVLFLYRYSLPNVQVVGKTVLSMYTRALRVKWESHVEQIKPYSAFVNNVTDRLVYSSPSADYCEANAEIGSLGTVGRQCDPNVPGTGSCSQLCCNRRYNERRRIVKEKCKCKFVWCCRVECELCTFVTKHYTCR